LQVENIRAAREHFWTHESAIKQTVFFYFLPTSEIEIYIIFQNLLISFVFFEKLFIEIKYSKTQLVVETLVSLPFSIFACIYAVEMQWKICHFFICK